MTVALANALRKGWFAYTNNEKANNITRADRVERRITSYCQDIGAADDTIRLVGQTTQGSKCVNALTSTMNASEPTSKLLQGASFVAKWASKLVNPILCVAAFSRAMSEEDKKSALIKESGAILGMFAFEGVTKAATGIATTGKGYQAVASALKLTKLMNKLPNNKYTGILKAILFVAASCTGFYLGGKAGKAIADNTTAKDFQHKKMLIEQAKINQLTASKTGLNTNYIA